MKCCCLFLFSLPSRATDFVNLDFDDPNLTNLAFYNTPPFGERRLYGPILDLLRGWSVTEGGKPYSGLMAYSVAPDGGGVFPSVQMALAVGTYTIGKYNIEFASIRPPQRPGLEPLDMVISQVGTVPADAYYLTGIGGTFAAINGSPLTVTRPYDFLIPFWDVHEYAGKEVTLSFTFHGNGNYDLAVLDIVGFTTPEPSTWALLAVGTLILGVGCLPRRR